MFSKMLIRNKILYSTIALTCTLVLLIGCSLHGVRSYQQLTINIQHLSHEIARVDYLKSEVERLQDETSRRNDQRFLEYLKETRKLFEQTLVSFRSRQFGQTPLLMTTDEEVEALENMLIALAEVKDLIEIRFSLIDEINWKQIEPKLGYLTTNLASLSSSQRERMVTFRGEMRAQYHTWYAMIVLSAVASLVNVGLTFWFFRSSVVKPFKLLLNGSKSIAGGEFDHRIRLESQDELAELAGAMNSMTNRFVEIRDNLNEQVQQRTQEVVRSEQLASVGFLAAGVAHEINNPLASIAWSAEALESRLHEVLHCTSTESKQSQFDPEQIDVLRDYLKSIQDEAFRCKAITERLLDFSRLGESSKKQETEIHAAIADVCELVKHLGQYRNRKLRFVGKPGIAAWVSPTEFKQVILNLITNALDATEDGGVVQVLLDANQQVFNVKVIDLGCGMTDEVMKHLFEPFFTRRRDGRGTGLGLSITYQIVQDHHGSLVPTSQGAGTGSTMDLTIPIRQPDAEDNEIRKAA